MRLTPNRAQSATPTALLLCLTAACGGKRDASPDAQTTRTDDAGQEPVVRADAGQDELLVDIAASETTLCKGDCSDLTVRTDNARGDLTFAWLEGASGSAATQTVCPEQTTAYRVRADEADSPGLEFSTEGRSAEDRLTISVKDCSMPADDAVLCEKRFRYDAIDIKGPLGARKPWLFTSLGPSPLIGSDPQGNLLLGGTFGGRIDLGAGELRASSAANGVVVKMDGQCNVVWSRALVPPVTSDALMTYGLGVDAQGNALVVSVAGPSFELTFLSPTTLSFGSQLLIHKLSPAGEILYEKRFAVGPGVLISDISVTPNGAIYLSGMANSLSDLGDGPLGVSPVAFFSFLLGLDPEGNRTVAQSLLGAYRIAAGADRLLVQRGLFDKLDVIDTLTGAAFGNVKPISLSALSYPNHTEVWNVPQEASSDALGALSNGGFVKVQSSLSGTIDDQTQENVDFTKATLGYLDSTGADAGSLPLVDMELRTPALDVDSGLLMGNPNLTTFHRFDVGLDDALAIGGSFGPRLTILGTTLEAVSQRDVFIAKIDAGRTPLWARSLSWGETSDVNGLTLTPNGDVFVAGVSSVSVGGEFDVVFAKLRGTP